mmetsp:Transcript_78099/g.228926  ORF Transcript_78099/g.228926 Transcript_78099/m.228926 type:complete len:116 (-) Transcript_78099:948-1295(-)
MEHLPAVLDLACGKPALHLWKVAIQPCVGTARLAQQGKRLVLTTASMCTCAFTTPSAKTPSWLRDCSCQHRQKLKRGKRAWTQSTKLASVRLPEQQHLKEQEEHQENDDRVTQYM